MFRPSARITQYLGSAASCVAIAAFALHLTKSEAQSSKADIPSNPASPIYGVTIPPGYRDWKLISTSTLKTDKVDQLRAQFGNDIAIKAYKEGKLPFPDGAIIVAQHWTRIPAEDNNKVLAGPFPGAQSAEPGTLVNFQVMVKDSKKYAATGGWGFADFKNGKPGDEALHQTCFACHVPAANHDYVFTRYAP